MSTFDQAFARVVGHEGGFTANAADAGNWTGGLCGKGECRGTKFGVSAASYPTLDIRNLTLDAARAIYRRDYWDRVHGDRMAPALGLLVFDAAVNNGVGRATQWLQMALQVEVDGKIGPGTLTALASRGVGQALAVEFMAQRIFFMAKLPTWKTFGLGWSRRLARLPYDGLELADV